MREGPASASRASANTGSDLADEALVVAFMKGVCGRDEEGDGGGAGVGGELPRDAAAVSGGAQRLRVFADQERENGGIASHSKRNEGPSSQCDQ